MAPKVLKPWGWYQDLYRSSHLVVKIIEVNPHCRLSLQKHQHRTENWYGVKGTATCYLSQYDIDPLAPFQYEDLQRYFIREGEQGYQLFIGRRDVHRLTNETDEPIQILEIQTGLCDEEDIEQLEDDFGRAGRQDE